MLTPEQLEQMTKSEPYRLYLAAERALSAWADANDPHREQQADGVESLADEHIREMELGNAVRELAVQGRVWKLDVSTLDDFMERIGPMDSPRLREWLDRLQAFFHRYQDEAEARWMAAQQGGAPRVADEFDPIDLAIMKKMKHPELPDRRIAEIVGCSPSTLSRSKRYQDAKVYAVDDPPPRGSKDGDTGAIEAYDD